MIRAHLRRSLGGGLGGPLRSLPQDSVARAKPALEAEHSTLGRANPHHLASLPTWKGSVFERRLCRRNEYRGEVSEGGRSPPPSGTYREYASRAALGRRLAVGPFSSLWPGFSD